jgi:hypothetical protein
MSRNWFGWILRGKPPKSNMRALALKKAKALGMKSLPPIPLSEKDLKVISRQLSNSQ